MLVGPLADSLRLGAGVQRSIDVLAWPDDRQAAETVVRDLGFLTLGPVQQAEAGRAYVGAVRCRRPGHDVHGHFRVTTSGLSWA